MGDPAFYGPRETPPEAKCPQFAVPKLKRLAGTPGCGPKKGMVPQNSRNALRLHKDVGGIKRTKESKVRADLYQP